MDSDLLDFALGLISKTQDMISEHPGHYMLTPHGELFQSILNAIQPPFYQRPLSERIDICRSRTRFAHLWLLNLEHSFLFLTTQERENMFLYREQILPLIMKCYFTAIKKYPSQLDGCHLLLARVFHNYSNQLKDTSTLGSPQSLVMLCHQLWVEYVSSLPHPRLRLGRVRGMGSDSMYTPIRILAQAVHAAGVDLMRFGSEEASLLAKGLVDQDIMCTHHSAFDYYGYDKYDITIRVIGFSYGPNPDDWQCWFSNFRDEYTGQFWEMVENSEPELRVPGACVY